MRALTPMLAAILLLGGTELVCRFSGGFIKSQYLPLRPVGLSPAQAAALEAVLRGEPTYLTFSPTLGWTIRPDARSANGLYRSNAQGLRADRDYDRTPPRDRIRITAFGESYVHADDVTFEQSWGERLRAADGRFEVVNAGVPGTAVDHALVHYGELSDRLDSDIVLIGFMSENINRLVSVFAPYYIPDEELPLAKPRFELQGGRLVLLPPPLRGPADLRRLLDGDPALFAALGEHDYWYHIRSRRGPEDVFFSVRLAKIALFYARRLLGPDHFIDWHWNYVPDSEPFRIACAVLDAFYRAALAHGSLPVVVFFPRASSLAVQPPPHPHAALLAGERRAGHRVLDVTDAFTGPPSQYGITSEWLASHSHYPPAANDVVGRWLALRLAEMGLTQRAAVRAAVRQERERLGAGGPRT
jgi:hypothetical protein